MAAITVLSRPRRHPQVRYTLVPEGALIVLHQKGELKTLNPVGGHILDLSDGTRTVEEIAERIMQDFHVEKAEAESDTLAFLEDLLKSDIIEIK
jgi:hypothetical protein